MTQGWALRPKTEPDLMSPAVQSTPPFCCVSLLFSRSLHPEFSGTCIRQRRAFLKLAGASQAWPSQPQCGVPVHILKKVSLSVFFLPTALSIPPSFLHPPSLSLYLLSVFFLLSVSLSLLSSLHLHRVFFFSLPCSSRRMSQTGTATFISHFPPRSSHQVLRRSARKTAASGDTKLPHYSWFCRKESRF